ncbi:hypothetical protein [Paenibacillus wenxiniae]|uniref:Uncharacterized protein n=1 Tax=Paenibacillus wenxiniae TaxID=1636843 RepID=A0ABW4RCN3_9BACL
MRVLLLEDHEYPVNQVAGRVGAFARRVGSNILRYPSGTMVEVGADRRMIIGGQATEHRLMDKSGAWIELITRDEADRENESLHIDLSNSFDYCKGLEDRARDAENEARECRAELIQLYTDLLDTQVNIKRMANRITDMGVIRSDRMEAPTCAEASAQAQQEDCEGTGAYHG